MATKALIVNLNKGGSTSCFLCGVRRWQVVFVAERMVTTTAVTGCGLVHSMRLAARGHHGGTGLQELTALATSAVLSQTNKPELLVDVIDAAREFSGPTLDAAQPTLNAEKAA